MIHAPGWCGEAWVVMQALRNLGFPAAELYIATREVEGIGESICVVMKKDDREFTVLVGTFKHGDTHESIMTTWQAFVTDVNQASDQERTALWTASEVVQSGGPRYAQMIRALLANGFPVSPILQVVYL